MDKQLTKRLEKAFQGDPSPSIIPYTYPNTGYTDIEIAYGYIPEIGVELFPRFLKRDRFWVGARIYFTPDEDFLKRYEQTGKSKYLLGQFGIGDENIDAQNMMAIAQIKPKTDIEDAIADYSLVVQDVGPGRVAGVAFMLYDGPEFPDWFYETAE